MPRVNGLLIAISIYVLLQLAIGVYVGRRVRSDTDYLVAGRRLGYGLTTFSLFATWFGAETCIGSAGAIYSEGLSAGSRDPFGYAACLLLMGLVYAAPLWRRGLTTLGDLFRVRYGPGVERLAVLLLVPTSIYWAAAQIKAFAMIVGSAGEMDAFVATTLAAGVIIAYTATGGLLADAVTDVVQGVVLIAGLLIAALAVINGLGGVANVWAAIDAERLNVIPAGSGVLDFLETWSVPICGSVVVQELVSRVLGARSPQVARRSALLATVIYLSVGMIPAVIGLVGPKLLPDLESPETLLATVVQQYAGTVAYVIFAGALVSAILSTVDSALLAAGGLVAENLVASVWPRLDPADRLRVSRICVVSAGVIAYTMALFAERVYDLVESSTEVGSAAIFVVVTLALFTRIGGPAAATSALVAGTVYWIVGAIGEFPYKYITAMGVTLATYLVVARVKLRMQRAMA